MEDAKPKYMSLPSNVNLLESQPKPIPMKDTYFMKDKLYCRALGMLNHIANRMHPNIAFAVIVLMCYAEDPHPVH